MRKNHMTHASYTIYCLRNMVKMLKDFEDDSCTVYAVALNLITLLADDGRITTYEETMLHHVLSDLHRTSWLFTFDS